MEEFDKVQKIENKETVPYVYVSGSELTITDEECYAYPSDGSFIRARRLNNSCSLKHFNVLVNFDLASLFVKFNDTNMSIKSKDGKAWTDFVFDQNDSFRALYSSKGSTHAIRFTIHDHISIQICPNKTVVMDFLSATRIKVKSLFEDSARIEKRRIIFLDVGLLITNMVKIIGHYCSRVCE